MEQQVVGLDVSKAWLDGYLSRSDRRLRVSNDAAGIRLLIDAAGHDTACLVVMEASGGYEQTAHRELLAQGVLAAIVNPKRVRDFARGMGLEAKTDRIDAKLIARYGAVMRPAATPLPDPARLELREILACRRQLVAEIGKGLPRHKAKLANADTAPAMVAVTVMVRVSRFFTCASS